MFGSKNQTEVLILSITENSEIFSIQTHTIAQETLEFKITKPMETF